MKTLVGGRQMMQKDDMISAVPDPEVLRVIQYG